MWQVEVFNCRNDGQQRRNPGRVVGNSRAIKFGPLLADIQRCVGRENGINMRADRNYRTPLPFAQAANISNLVFADFVNPKRPKLFS
jgi:hypothetical protein